MTAPLPQDRRLPSRFARPARDRAGFLTPPRALALILALPLGVCVLPAALADNHQNLEAVRREVNDFILKSASRPEGAVAVEVGSLDPRLRLAACENRLTLVLAPGSRLTGNTMVSVRCIGNRPWSLYVNARVKVYEQVLVAARALPRDATLTQTDVRPEKHDLVSLTDTPLTNLNQAAGKLTTQALAPGDIIGYRSLKAARLVRRGDKVTILVSGNGLEVRTSGEALADGIEGESIGVRNAVTNKAIQAVVTAAGVVQVRL